MGRGELGCGAKCAKVLLFVFNFIFWLSGAVLLGLGIWAYVDQSSLTEKLGHIVSIAELSSGASLRTTAIIFMAVGAFIFLVGFCGCWGAIKEVRCLLGMYVLLLVLVIVCEIVAAVLAVVYRNKLKDALGSSATDYLKGSYNDTGSDKDLAWNFVMQHFECCGWNSPNDFSGSNFQTTNPTLTVPNYCCVPTDGKPADQNIVPKSLADCQSEAVACINGTSGCLANNVNFYHAGCYSGVIEFIKDNYLIFVCIAFVIAALELLGLLFAVCLCRALGREKESY